jgi:hypothetical protein
VGELELGPFGRFWLLIGPGWLPNVRGFREEDVHGLVQPPGDVELHLRVGPARHVGGAFVPLGAEAEADEVDHHVGLAELPRQHFFHRAIIRRKAGLVLGKAAFLLDFDLHRVAERAEFVGDAAQEDRGPRLHGCCSRSGGDRAVLDELAPQPMIPTPAPRLHCAATVPDPAPCV